MNIRWFCLFLLVWSCQAEKKTPPPPLPNTPQEVAQVWVEAFYRDSFARALSLSTTDTKEMIETLRKDLIPDVENIAFTISNMRCEVRGDSATCDYLYSEATERSEEFVSLLRVEGQWLVDERLQEDSEEFQQLQEEVRELFEEN